MNFEQAMNQAMTEKKHYEEPETAKPRGTAVSQGVAGITDVLDKEAQQRASKREATLLVGVPEK